MIDRLARVNEVVVVVALVINIVLTFSNTAIRAITGQDMAWVAEIASMAIAVITFLGAPAYFRRTPGMAYTAVVDALSGRSRALVSACGLWIVLGVSGLTLVLYPAFFNGMLDRNLPVLGLNDGFVAIWLGIGLVLLIVYCLEKMIRQPKGALLGGLAVALVVTALSIALRHAYAVGTVDQDPFLFLIPVLIVAFLTGAPIAIVLGLGGVLYFVVTGDAPLVAIPSAFQTGVNSYILLAVPFFMLAGTLMEVTGMAQRLVEWVQQWIGHWTGGLLVAQVIAMYIFSGVSGSKAADVATVGSVMKGPLRQYGYPATEAVAVLAAAAAMGETIPPSLMLLILGSITSLSIGSLFVAGIVPAAVLALVLIAVILVRSRARNWHKGPPFRLGRALASTPMALPALMVPVIVIGGIVGGIASPTESSSFAVVYGFAAALVVYRSVRRETAWTALRDATLTAGMVLFIVSAANVLSQAIIIDGLGQILAAFFSGMHSQLEFLFISVGALIVIGFVLEGFPAILIAAPILLPIATRMGVDPLQYGILLTMAVGIGVFMPPVGIGYYITCAIGDAPVNATMRPSAVYNVFLVLGLAIVVLFPALTLALPHYFGLH
jgi:tripartite ATP-independent transporter DctM subunit